MMPSSSQVLDHQLIFHINVWTWAISSSAKQRRGEIWQKTQQLLSKHRPAVDGKNSQKTAVAHWSYASKHVAGRSAAS